MRPTYLGVIMQPKTAITNLNTPTISEYNCKTAQERECNRYTEDSNWRIDTHNVLEAYANKI
jgi:hypothetical protein